MTKKQRRRKKKLQSLNRHLVKKYYWLEPRRWDGKRDKDYDYTYIHWGWSDGWNKAFGNMYMKELGDAINEAGQKDFQILQVKEKFGCYDDQTEVLTKEGWKYFKDLSYEDEIATLNSETNYLEYQRPTEIIAEHYHGKMYKLENRGVSLCVTPNHNLYVAKGSYYNGAKNNLKRYYDFELCNPEKYFRKDKRFYKTCKWEGKLNEDTYKIKGIEYDTLKFANDENGTLRHYIKKDLEFNLIAWLRFLGFYIAEGCVSNRKDKTRYGEINISFNKYDERDLVEELISGIGFEAKFNMDRGYARFFNITLGEWLNTNCGHMAYNKKVPQFIKNLPPFYIEEFLKYLYIGDGHKTSTSNILTTASKQLSDDVQELLLKAGYAFREYVRDNRGNFGGFEKYYNYPIITKHIRYDINWLQLPDIEINMSTAEQTKSFEEKWIEYNRCVYCVTVPNHIIYVRRNGKGVWCGNSCRLYCGGSTRKVLDIIDKYERISEHICERCGCEAPMIQEGSWLSVYCPRCYRLLYRRREQWFNTKEGYIPKTDEEINEIYKGCIIDKPDENGEYHMQKTYTMKHYRSGDTVDVVYDISDTVEKIQKRISKFKGGK